MVTLIVIINILISVILLYIARKIWQIREKIIILTDSLNSCERDNIAIFRRFIENIYTEEEKIYHLRQQYQNLKRQIQQVQQIIKLIIIGRKIWQKYL
jgi:uncharacterized membrane protein YraQ (UPF0718 family)